MSELFQVVENGGGTSSGRGAEAGSLDQWRRCEPEFQRVCPSVHRSLEYISQVA